MNILFYDTETTGFPVWKEPSEDPRQPHIVQLAAKLVDSETRIVKQSMNLISLPVDWIIPEDAENVHGITTAEASKYGHNEKVVAFIISRLSLVSDLRIGHNESFDARIVRIALKRFFGGREAGVWKDKETACTMRLSTPVCGLKKANGKTPKWPTLEEAYRFLIGKEMENAHNAMADVNATIDVYFAMIDQGLID